MSKLVTKTLKFTPSDATDISEHRIRIGITGTVFDYSLKYYSAPFDRSTSVEGKVSVNLTALLASENIQGTYVVFITAVDKAGNESDPFTISSTALDFTAPSAPSQATIV